MKRISTLLIIFTLLSASQELRGQTLTFLFKNPQLRAGPKFQYEIWIKSNNGTSRMGEVLVYNDYNTSAFGTNIVQNGKVAVLKNSAVFGDSYSTNPNQDNTSSRFAFSWTYVGTSGSGVIIPASGDGVLAYTVQIDIANSSGTSGIALSSLMNGEQYFDDHTAWPLIDLTSTLNVPLLGLSKVKRDEGVIPQSYMLYPSYPNPFNPSTTITYDLAAKGFVSLKISDALGQEVATLVNETQTAGRYHAKFDGESLASGVYFSRLTTNRYSGMQKMLLLK